MLGKWRPFSASDEQKIVEEIKSAELQTSGELRVHVEKWCKTNPVFKAQNVFHHLKMDETEDRSGVLIYVAIKEKSFAIIGDEGINNKVPSGFWDSTRDHMQEHFSKGDIPAGLISGIKEAGEQLAKFFPVKSDDKNELKDEISYG
ncbi:MAG: TPM domain-containing protein [Bacteroidia bacterium]